MALDSILKRIQDEADSQAQAIVREARQQSDEMLAAGRLEAEKLYREAVLAAGSLAAQKKQRERVLCHLESRKRILRAKQEVLDALFAKCRGRLKKGQIRKQVVAAQGSTEEVENPDFFLSNLRRDIESELARMLFP